MGAAMSNRVEDNEDIPVPRTDNIYGHMPEEGAESVTLPRPQPPLLRQKDIFNRHLCDHIDEHALKTPAVFLSRSFEELAYRITKPCSTDLERARALFTWVATVGMTLKTVDAKEGTPLEYMDKIRRREGNKAWMFSYLCLATGVPCVIITGVNKSAPYRLGGPVNTTELCAQWNAVLIDDQWRLVDTFWASTCMMNDQSKEWVLLGSDNDQHSTDNGVEVSSKGDVFLDMEGTEGEGAEQDVLQTRVNEFFFLTDPDMLLSTHLPDDASWQMTETPISAKDFEEQAYLRERFFQLDASLIEDSLSKCVVSARKGELDIAFGIPPSTAQYMQFASLIYIEQGTAAPGTDPLERYVFYQKKSDMVKFALQFPIKGKFKVSIFGMNTIEHNTMELVASYLVKAKAKKGAQPLPDIPEIGWGPGAEMERAGLSTDQKEAVIETHDGHVELRFKKSNPLSVLQAMKNNHLDDWLLRRVAVLREEGDDVLVSIRLPEPGEYGFKLYGDSKDHEGDLANICNYLIKSVNPLATPAVFPKLHRGVLGPGQYADPFGVQPISHPGGDIKTADDKLTVTFSHLPDTELMVEPTSESHTQAELARNVTRTERDGETTFNVGLHSMGELGLNVYARKKDSASPRIYHAYSYLVDSTQDIQRLAPINGKPSTSEEQEVQTSRGTVDVADPPASLGKDLVGQLERRQAQDPVDNNALARTAAGDAFRAKLPNLGTYDLDLFDKCPNGALVDVSSTVITKHEPVPGQEEKGESDEDATARRKLEVEYADLLKALRQSVRLQDADKLAKSIKAFEARGVPEVFKQEVDQAKQLLEYLQIKNDLNKAIGARNISALEAAIVAGEKAHPAVRKRLGPQLALASKSLEQLRRVEKLRHDILQLNQRTIAEIRSYATPPEAVYKVMKASFLVLGDPESVLKDWKSIQALIGKTGKMSVKRRVKEYDVDRLTAAVSNKVTSLLSTLSLDLVRDVSAGAATFYVWTVGMQAEADYRLNQATISTR